MSETRSEADSMGTMQVPAGAYYGAQTARAVENFPVSGLRLPPAFVRAMGAVKLCAARVNGQLGTVDDDKVELIVQAAQEVVDGKLDDQFVVDVFQTGSGTSTNMNANEVIAGRANEIATGTRGGKQPVHPNDHVNFGQSSNDVVPTALHVSVFETIQKHTLPALRRLNEALEEQATALDEIVKIGRTHLQDAVPIRLGQEFSGYATQVRHGIGRLEALTPRLSQLAIGGTAVGTGLNTHPEFPERMVRALGDQTGLKFQVAENHFEALASRDAAVEASGALRTVAVSLAKIANDIRWLASGPRCGLGEIGIPATQPGSSIMPGKVNPVMSESVLQVAAKVVGNDAAVTTGGLLGGNFELNVMKPVIAYSLLESATILANVSRLFADRCVAGIRPNAERCGELIEQSLAMCTALAPHIGYDAAAAIAKQAYAEGRTVRQVAAEKTDLTAEQLVSILDPRGQTERGVPE